MTATGNFIFICPACGYKARLPDQFSGRTIKCPGCQVPQVATAPLNTEHKTASFIRVAATPVPFTMPQEQLDALAGAQVSSVAPPAYPAPAPKAFPSPLPGAIQVSTDRISNQTPIVPVAGAPIAKAVQGGTVDFTCNSCNARLRLPAHYSGKSILCPKCSTPQKVLDSNAAVPMDTTRSIALKEEGAAAAQPGTGTGTGIRVRVTPIPTTYPTPLPTAMTAPQTDVLGLVRPSPFATPVAAVPESPTPISARATTPIPEPEAELTSVIDAIASNSDVEPPVKPHPSRGKLKTESVTRSASSLAVKAAVKVDPIAAPIAGLPTPAPKPPVGLIYAAGALVLLAIILAAGLTYYALALGETRSRLDEAQRVAKESAEREHSATKKATELDHRIAELEAALKAAEEKAALEKAALEKSAAEKPGLEKTTPEVPAAEPVIPTPAEEPPK